MATLIWSCPSQITSASTVTVSPTMRLTGKGPPSTRGVTFSTATRGSRAARSAASRVPAGGAAGAIPAAALGRVEPHLAGGEHRLGARGQWRRILRQDRGERGEAPGGGGEHRGGRHTLGALEIGVDEQHRGALGDARIGAAGAQQSERRRARAGGEPGRVVAGERRRVAHAVGRADALAKVERTGGADGVRPAGAARRAAGEAEFEPGGQHPAAAETGGEHDRAGDGGERLLGRVVRRNQRRRRRRGLGGFGAGDQRGDAAEPLHLVPQPVGLPVPPGERGEDAVERAPIEAFEHVPVEAGGPAQHAAGRAGGAQAAQHDGQGPARQARKAEQANAGDPGLMPFEQAGAPPIAEPGGVVQRADPGDRRAPGLDGAAWVEHLARAGRREDRALRRGQREAGGHAVEHDVEQRHEAARLRHLREPGEALGASARRRAQGRASRDR